MDLSHTVHFEKYQSMSNCTNTEYLPKWEACV